MAMIGGAVGGIGKATIVSGHCRPKDCSTDNAISILQHYILGSMKQQKRNRNDMYYGNLERFSVEYHVQSRSSRCQ